MSKKTASRRPPPPRRRGEAAPKLAQELREFRSKLAGVPAPAASPGRPAGAGRPDGWPKSAACDHCWFVRGVFISRLDDQERCDQCGQPWRYASERAQ